MDNLLCPKRVYNDAIGSGCTVRFGRFPLLVVLLVSSLAIAENPPPARMTKLTRQEIIRVFNAELCYVRTNFPMGKTGLKLKKGMITPSGDDLQHLMSLWGPAAKPGDQARITDVAIKDSYIHFELNGGPVKKQKWYQRIEIQGAGGSTPIAPSDSNANARGSFVDVYFDKYVPELTGTELKLELRPVLEFDAKSSLEAYLVTDSASIEGEINNHRVMA